MTAYATRTPLALVTNTVDTMGEQPRRSARRSSARLAEKEDGSTPTKEASSTVTTTTTTTATAKRGAKGAVAQTDGRKGKRKLDYDEDDDGFMFTRTKTKKPRASKSGAAAAAPPPPAEEESEPKPLQVRKARSKTTEPSGREEQAPTTPARKGRGRPAKAKGDDIFGGDDGRRRREPAHTPEPKTHMGGDVTKFALPFADTPVIRRNKAMRQKGADGSRRSSLSMRGRRASSLIDSGTSNALPHAEVPASEFYKHIEGGLPEPRRMRQLLTWCATRALGEKPAFGTKDANAQLAAHEIKQQLLQDFAAQSELSDWFSREDRPQGTQSLRPNPRNVANQAKIQDLEARIARMKSERETWSSLLKPSSTPLLALPSSSAPPPSHSTHLNASDLSALSVLTASAPAASSTHESDDIPSNSAPSITAAELSARAAARASKVAARAEFDVDRLADAAHVLAQHLAHAEGVGRRVLRVAADTLEKRHRHRSRGHATNVNADNDAVGADGDVDVGMRDVLRTLSRADP